MFSGRGAKPTTLPAPLPPSYDKVASVETNPPLYNESSTFDPPDTRPRKRKLSQDVVADSATVRNNLKKLEAMFDRQREQDMHTANQSLVIQELRAEVAELREQSATYQKKFEDLEAEVAGLRKQVVTCQKKHEDLEVEVAGLREAQAIAEDGETVRLAEIWDDIESLGTRIDFVECGNNNDEFRESIKEEIFDEMAARVRGC
jgi:predicted RNase H-like nuclease (RuvC/YqgF family)